MLAAEADRHPSCARDEHGQAHGAPLDCNRPRDQNEGDGHRHGDRHEERLQELRAPRRCARAVDGGDHDKVKRPSRHPTEQRARDPCDDRLLKRRPADPGGAVRDEANCEQAADDAVAGRR